MKNVYKVSYEARYSGVRIWMADNMRVLANGDAQHAVDICRRAVLKESFKDVTKSGKRITRRVTGFRFTGVEMVTHVDVP